MLTSDLQAVFKISFGLSVPTLDEAVGKQLAQDPEAGPVANLHIFRAQPLRVMSFESAQHEEISGVEGSPRGWWLGAAGEPGSPGGGDRGGHPPRSNSLNTSSTSVGSSSKMCTTISMLPGWETCSVWMCFRYPSSCSSTSMSCPVM